MCVCSETKWNVIVNVIQLHKIYCTPFNLNWYHYHPIIKHNTVFVVSTICTRSWLLFLVLTFPVLFWSSAQVCHVFVHFIPSLCLCYPPVWLCVPPRCVSPESNYPSLHRVYSVCPCSLCQLVCLFSMSLILCCHVLSPHSVFKVFVSSCYSWFVLCFWLVFYFGFVLCFAFVS